MAVTPLVPLTLFSCIPLILYGFQRFGTRPRMAVIVGFLFSFLFLPNYQYPLPFFPDYTKINAACYGVLLGTALFHPEVFRRFRLSGWDVPMGIWCVTPLFTSVSNGLGVYDGLVSFLGQSVKWGAPYLLGRLYFDHRRALEDLALGFFLGALAYIPFCLYEVVMSPRLHRIVYGFHPHDFSQAKRGGGWRPVVFMHHGLMNAMWMLSGLLAGWGLWLSGRLRARLPAWAGPWGGAGVAGLFVTMFLLKSTGALGLMLLGVLLLTAMRLRPFAWPFWVLAAIPLLYVTTRSTHLWDGRSLVDAASAVASEERTGSLSYRIYNETILAERAWERPWLGWGGWRRSFVTNDRGEIVSVPDGMWILAFGKNGYIGLYALMGVFLTPVWLFLRTFPARRWRDPAWLAVLSMPLLVVLFALDSLLNDMYNPLMSLLAGGLAGLALRVRRGGEVDGGAGEKVGEGDAQRLSRSPRLL